MLSKNLLRGKKKHPYNLLSTREKGHNTYEEETAILLPVKVINPEGRDPASGKAHEHRFEHQ